METMDDQVLREGDMLPAGLQLVDQDGTLVQLDDTRGRTVILYFYPRDGSIGCKTQSCSMRDNWPLLQSEDIVVFGVNSGSPESHRDFAQKLALPFQLLSDPEGDLAQRFGFAARRNVLGVSFMWFERSTVIVDPDGSIRAIMRKVRASSHFDLLRVQLGTI